MKTARVLSYLFHPVLTSSYLLAFVVIWSSTGLRQTALWLLLTIGVSAGIPSLFIAYGIARGRVGDFQIRLRAQRLWPLAVALTCSLLALALAVLLHAPAAIVATIAAGILPGVLLTIITRFWKISFHAATVAGAVAVLTWLLGPWALVGCGLIAVVAWSRVALGRHSVPQVLAGGAVGGGGAALILALLSGT